MLQQRNRHLNDCLRCPIVEEWGSRITRVACVVRAKRLSSRSASGDQDARHASSWSRRRIAHVNDADAFGPTFNSPSGRGIGGERCCRGPFHPVKPQLQSVFHGREQRLPQISNFPQFDLYRIPLVPFLRSDPLGFLPGACLRRDIPGFSVLTDIDRFTASAALPLRVMPLRTVAGVPGEDCYSER